MFSLGIPIILQLVFSHLGSTAKPEILFQPQDTVVTTRTFTVFCIKSKGTTVTWYHDGQEVDFRSHLDYRITADGSLHVTNALRSRDEGSYMCSLIGSQGRRVNSRVAIIKFPYLNLFTVGDWAVAKVEGTSAVLRCKPPDSFPHGSIHWHKHDPLAPGGLRAIKSSSHHAVTRNGELHFAYLLTTDAGHYDCKVFNALINRSESRTIILSVDKAQPLVNQAPKVSDEFSKTKTAIKGEKFILECVVYGLPVPGVSLRKKGARATYGQTRGNCHTMVIESFTESDAGKYKCEATGVGGTRDSRVTFVKMEAKPEWITKPQDVTGGINSDITIPCQGHGIPALQYTWFFNGQPLLPSDKVTLKGGSITIHRLTHADAGIYQCIPRNKHGHLFSAIEVNVAEIAAGFGPGSKAPLKSQEALIHTTVELPCNPTGAPRPSVRWQAGEIHIRSGGRLRVLPNGNLRISNVSKIDARKYTCVVSNSLGSESRDSQLIVLDRFAITEQPVDTKFIVGRNETLTCGVLTMLNSSREVSLEWQRGFFPVSPSERVKLTSVTLHPVNGMVKKRLLMSIHDVHYSDGGIYTCKAASSGKSSKISQVYAFITVQGPPNPPASVSIGTVNINSWKVNISWILGAPNNSPITKVVVEYSTKFAPSVWKVAVEVHDPRQTSAEVTLAPGVQYTFRVFAANLIGNGLPNKIYTSIETPPTAPTSIPRNIVLKGVHPASLQITWEPLPHEKQNGPGIYYILYYKRSSSASEEMERREARGTASFSIRGSIYKEEYEVQLQAANNYGFGPKSRIFRGQTGDTAGLAPSAKPHAPKQAPTNLEVRILTATMAYATWTGVPNTVEATQGKRLGYKVYFWKVPSGQKRTDAMFKSTTETAVTLQLEAYTSYRFQVVSFNSVGDGPGSNVVGPLTTPETIPGQPRILTLNTLNSSDVLLQWNPPIKANGFLTGYKVSALGISSGEVVQTLETAGETHLWIEGLQQSKAYRFSVRAVNSIGEGPPVLALFDLAAAPEQAPADYVTVAFDNKAREATVTWKAWAYLNEIDGYRIYYGVPGKEFQTIDVNKYKTRDTIYGLNRNRQHHFQVAAFKMVGISHFLVGPRSKAVIVGKVNVEAMKDSGSGSVRFSREGFIWMIVCGVLALMSPGMFGS